MRLDGWKSIASHFGRDRTTVIRWAAERAMPIHRIPGGTRGSVYATDRKSLTHGLARRGRKHRQTNRRCRNRRQPNPQPPRMTTANRRWPVRGPGCCCDHRHAGGGGLCLVRIHSARTLGNGARRPGGRSAVLSMQRVDWANRKPETIAKSIAKLQRVDRYRTRTFAPRLCRAGRLLPVGAPNFGSLTRCRSLLGGRAPRGGGYSRLRIDPDQGRRALRARAFIAYWWNGDRPAAGARFQTGLGPQRQVCPDLVLVCQRVD